MDNQSNSKFYHGDCRCKKKEVLSTIAIQCSGCIINNPEQHCRNHSGYECSCKDVEIKHLICETCARIRDKIEDLHNDLDILNHSIIYNIKEYIDCTEDINKMHIIALELRQLNRELLENLVKHNSE